MGLNQNYLAFLTILVALVFFTLLGQGLISEDLDYLSPAEQRAHAVYWLPRSSMLQAADTCDGGHFKYDETYGYWVQDFQLLLHSDGPAASFEHLVRQPTILGQLYGLAGLWLTDSAAFDSAFALVEPRDTAVTVAEGCAWTERQLAEVLDQIASGYWPRALTKAEIDIH